MLSPPKFLQETQLQEPAPNPSTMPISPWANLHASMLDLIINLVQDDPITLIYMSYVCKNWASIIKDYCQTFHCRSQFPWMQLEPPLYSTFFRFYSLVNKKIFDIPYPPSLLVSNGDGSMHMFYPSSIKGFLFMTHSTDDSDPNLNRNVHAININPLTRAHFLLPKPSDLPSRTPTRYFHIVKVVIILSHGRSREPPSIVVQYDGECNLAFARPGDNSWTALVPRHLPMRDIISHSGRLFAIKKDGELLRFDLGQPLDPPASLCRISKALLSTSWDMHLLESVDGDELFCIKWLYVLVRGQRVFKTNFLMFRLDESRGEWEEVRSLKNNHALFFDSGNAMFVPCGGWFPQVSCGYLVDYTSSFIQVYRLAEGSNRWQVTVSV